MANEYYRGPALYGMYGKDLIQEWFTYTYYKLEASLDKTWHYSPYTTWTISQKWTVDYFLYLYNAVGKDYKWWYFNWRDNNSLKDYLTEPKFYITLMVDNEPSGFAIVKMENPDNSNLEYFGIMKHVHGQGLGKKFLLDVQRLTAYTRNKMWVYTCSTDHPAALPTYKACGFKIVEEKQVSEYYPITVIGESNE